MWPVSRVLLIPIFFYCLCPAAAQTAAATACAEPSVGAVVGEPEDLRSQNGVLRATLDYRQFSDDQGRVRYCYLAKDGSRSPNLRVKAGDEVVLTLKNDLPEAVAEGSAMPMPPSHGSATCAGGGMNAASTNLHFHGLVIPPVCHQDDVLHTAIAPGAAPFEYKFKIPAGQPPGLYWYHPHIHGFTKTPVLGGASGALIVEGIQAVNPLLAGLPERVLIIRDQDLVNPQPAPVASSNVPAPIVLRDAEGDILNNGNGLGKPAKDLSLNYVPVPYPEYRPAIILMKPGEKQFWRVLNASAITYLDIQIMFDQQPRPLGLVAMDGVSISSQDPAASKIEWKTHILLAPAARAEFIVQGPPLGVKAAFVTRSVDTGPAGENDPTRPLAMIAVAADAPEPRSVLIANLAFPPADEQPPLRSATPARERRLYFSERPQDPNNPNSATQFFITVDGETPRQFDSNSLPNIAVHAGEVEDWIIENRSTELHAFHIHQTHFQLLEWNGVPLEEPYLRDTINVAYWDGKSPVYPSVKLRMDFRDPTMVGTFVYHCHLLEHEDGGMMGTIRVLPPLAKRAFGRAALQRRKATSGRL